MSYLASDSINVFISSRLIECLEERQFAKNAVKSLAYEPIMFESAGARSHAPRTVYLRGLDESHIFLGIYAEGYGYIADDMEISGLEDEYRYSKNKGIPRLVYVKRNCKTEPKLKALLDEIYNSENTIDFYQRASELEEKIRASLTTLVAEYFHRARGSKELYPPEPAEILNVLVIEEQRIDRTNLEKQLIQLLNSDSVVNITGSLGVGKTVFLAAFAHKKSWGYVQCGDRAKSEIVADAANVIRRKLGLPPQAYLNTRNAEISLKAAWGSTGESILVLDDVRSVEFATYFLSLLTINNDQKLIISSRDLQIPSMSNFTIPPLTKSEVNELIEKAEVSIIDTNRSNELYESSQGNPLYLRYYLKSDIAVPKSNIFEYEETAWNQMSPEAREALSYIAWSPNPLKLADLSYLLKGTIESIEETAALLESTQSFTIESARGFSIFHPHAKITAQDLIKKSAARLEFYTSRLSKWFEEKHDYTSAFRVLYSANQNIPRRLLELSSRHSSIQGNVTSTLDSLHMQLEIANREEHGSHKRDLLIYLAQTQCSAGNPDAALESIEAARAIDTTEPPVVELQEIEASILALSAGEIEAYNTLKKLKAQYIDDKKTWEAARISLDLSIYYIRQSEGEKAAEEARSAMEMFEEHNDEYGVNVAKMNLLSSLSSLPDRKEEAAQLLKEVHEHDESSPRERALICNVLGRYARTNGDTDSAKEYAREALEIGRDLGDINIETINLINLGNAHRDAREWDLALENYEAADKIANQSKLVLQEASAQELMASVFNRKGDGDRAKIHSTHAISLAKGGIAPYTESSAMEELAYACELTGEKLKAAEHWLRYAKLEIEMEGDLEDGSHGFERASAIYREIGDLEAYIKAYKELFLIPFDTDDEFSLGELLVQDLPKILDNVAEDSIFDIVTYHARFALDDTPGALSRQIYAEMISTIFARMANPENPTKVLRAALAISMALPGNALSLNDIINTSSIISKSQLPISFRTHQDGAVNWVLRLDLGEPVIISISQMDDRPDVALVALCLALALSSFTTEIEKAVLVGSKLPRNRVNIQIVNYNEAKELLPLDKIGLEKMKGNSAVTRAVDIVDDSSLPVFVFTSDSLTEEWQVGSGKVNSGQELFANVFLELVYHLQAGQIELESLYPKIANVVKQTIV